MKITRALKNAKWEYDEETQLLHLEIKHPIATAPDGVPDVVVETVQLNRTYAFSLARFLIRVFFRMSMKRRPKRQETEDEES